PRTKTKRLRPSDVLRIGTSGLRARKLRAALSALGIAIGIGAIVSVLGVSASSQANLIAELGSLGNLLTVAPGQALDGTPAPLPAAAEGMIRAIPPVRPVAAIADIPNVAVYRSAAMPSADSGGLTVAGRRHRPARRPRRRRGPRRVPERRERSLSRRGARLGGGAEPGHPRPALSGAGRPVGHVFHRGRHPPAGAARSGDR